jgi:hypothetical protein
MENQNQTSGQTTSAIYEPEIQTYYIKDIFDETYVEELDWLEVECMTGSGELITLNLQARHIKRWNLALHKGEAERKYFDYIMKNY